MPRPPDRRAARAAAIAHLHAQVSDPALRAALTPDYAFGCKRVLLSDAFYPAVASVRRNERGCGGGAPRGG